MLNISIYHPSRVVAIRRCCWSSLALFTLQNLGVALVWRSPSDGVNVELEVSFTLLNREHFSENKTFALPNATFNHTQVRNGNTCFIKVGDLLTHRPRYVDTNGEFIVELRMGKIRTYFQKDFQFAEQRTNNNTISNHSSDSNHSSSSQENDDLDALEVTSNDFTFGPFNWNLTAKPQPQPPTTSWAVAAASAVAASKRNALKQSKNRKNVSDRNLDDLGLSLTLKRRPHGVNNQSRDVDIPCGLLARVAFKVRDTILI